MGACRDQLGERFIVAPTRETTTRQMETARYVTLVKGRQGDERHPEPAWNVAADAWVSSVSAAVGEKVVLEHADRGVQQAEDVARDNAHDAAHRAWDIERILTRVGQSTKS
ncbi:hypothetical protein [Streptomyces sp. NPDC000878]